ncbi:MAG: hypothetical protein AAF629_05380, partial [Chloroflexota bacterium]
RKERRLSEAQEALLKQQALVKQLQEDLTSLRTTHEDLLHRQEEEDEEEAYGEGYDPAAMQVEPPP